MKKLVVLVIFACFCLFSSVILALAEPVKSEMDAKRYPVVLNGFLEDMIGDGKYANVNNIKKFINTNNFPSQGEPSVSVIRLISFNQAISARTISSKNALVKIDKRGFRPATAHELAAFGAAYPDVQKEFPVIALGSVWQSPIGPIIVVLGTDKSRTLRLLAISKFEHDGGWPSHCRFAVVEK